MKQGCVLAPLLFSIYLAAMLDDEAFSGCGNMGVLLQTRIGANLFNVKQFAAKTKTSLNVAMELMYADDCAIVAHDHATMQHLTDRFHQAASSFGLQLNLRKTVYLYQPSPDCREHLPISVSGTDLENVSHFTLSGLYRD